MSIASVLFVLFLALKLLGVITWSWWWVTAPLWIGVIVWVIVVIGVLVIASKIHPLAFR